MHSCTSLNELASWLDARIASGWQPALARHGRRLQRLFDERGDVAYESYLRLLLAPQFRALRGRRAQWYPRLPGGLAHSRKRIAGSAVHQERWWAVAVCAGDDTPLGMLVVAAQERADRFEVACRPVVFAFDRMGIGRVRAELCRRLALDSTPPYSCTTV
jgi:hypothetical protein